MVLYIVGQRGYCHQTLDTTINSKIRRASVRDAANRGVYPRFMEGFNWLQSYESHSMMAHLLVTLSYLENTDYLCMISGLTNDVQVYLAVTCGSYFGPS